MVIMTATTGSTLYIHFARIFSRKFHVELSSKIIKWYLTLKFPIPVLVFTNFRPDLKRKRLRVSKFLREVGKQVDEGKTYSLACVSTPITME